MNNSFFSNAHNFQSAAMGSVDPRTGLFNYMILIAQLTGNNQLGPTQTITLSYNPLNEKNMGFGIGFSVGLTQYDRKNQLLALSTGERYKVTEFNNDVHLNQYKQDVVRFEKDVTQNAYRVIHKSGLIEVLTGPDNVDDLKVPVQIFTPLGHTLTLTWNFTLAPVPYLVSISDEENVLLTVDYELDSYTRITIWPDTTESYEIQLLFDYGYVTGIKKQSDNHTLKWEMRYDKYIYTNNKLLSEVLSPTGLKESVNYNFNGHKFPAGVDLPPLPYVSKYTQYPGHGANIVRTYEYTNYNFLGYGGEGRWNKNSDYLYGVLSDYQYGSTETWNDGTNQRHITRRYNNYHLQVSEVTQQNKCKREHKTEYYAQVGVDFDKQAPQFQLPKSATVRFNDSSDEEVTQTQFDEAGNPMVQIAPDGTRTEWIYYSVDGEGEDCPADPHGFKRYVKSKTVIPCRSSPEDKYRDVPIHQEVYRYAQLPTLSGAPASYAVVCNYRGLYCNDQLLHDRQTHYVDAVNLRDHGRIQYIDETVHSMPNTATALLTRENWKSRQKFSYTLKDETLVQNIDWVGHDQLGLTTQSIQSRFSRKLWHEVDAQGCTAQYHYDDLGRLKKHISNMNTKYTQEIHYAYAIENKGSLTTTQTDVWGNQVRTRFDGLGRAYQQEVLEKGQESQGWRIVSETEYDSWGRVVNQTRNDWLPMEQNAGEVRQVSSHECFEYDDWGLLHRVTQDTGVSVLQEYDPITRTAEITLQAEGVKFSKRTVVYNKRNQPLLHTLYDSQGKQYSQQANHYDGLGRLWTMVDTLGQETEYTYDLFGRVSTIRHSDGTVIQKSYSPFSKSNLVTQIQVGDHVLGTRSVDSLHRLTSTTSGGRTYHMAYPGDSLFPSQITDPLGTVITYQYESFLGNVPTQVDTDGIQQRFTYDPKTGAMVQASAVQQATHNMIYTASGRLQQETFHFDDTGVGAARTADYTYSPMGQLTGYQDIAGNTQQLYFDKFGRPVAILDPDVDTGLTYDAASRVKSWSVYNKQHDKRLTTTLDFDDFGREVKRQIRTETDILILEQNYTVKEQLASRTTRSQQFGVLRQETYTYDPTRHWLTEYDCSGTECPRDAYGFGITQQKFTYDRLGNMLTCITTLNDGSSDTATFTYSLSDPCQLHTVTHTHPGYPATLSLKYDGAGRLIQDEASRQLTYDALGRLIAVDLHNITSTYSYDASDRLVLQRIGEDKTHELYYQGETRVAEILRESGVVTRSLHAYGTPVATVTGNEKHLLGTDGHGSVLFSSHSDGNLTRYRYSPYGQQAAEEHQLDIPAYNGEWLDPMGGSYHLGNGYRAYNPVLMRFNAPDSWSPFGAGGLNAYAYCLGDPINRIDPTGHMSLGSIFGVILGSIGLVAGIIMAIPTGGASLSVGGAIIAGLGLLADATGIASAATEDSNPRVSSILGWVSLGFGVVVGMGAGISSVARYIQKMRGLTRSFSEVFTTETIKNEVMPRRMNMMDPPGASNPRIYTEVNSLDVHGINANDYVIAFRNAIRDERVVSIENPAGSGFHTIGINTTGLYPAGENQDIDFLRRALFRPIGDDSPIEIIQNVFVAQNEARAEQIVDITAEDFESLYLSFIRTSILNSHDMTDSVITTVGRLRFCRGVFKRLHMNINSNQMIMNRFRGFWSSSADLFPDRMMDWLRLVR